jgi:glutaredoxin 3
MDSVPNTEGVVVYTMDYCPYCERAKRLLGTRGVAFQEIHVEMDDDSTWDQLFKKSGLRTMPQIYHNDQVVGGYTELAELDSKDQLQSLKK